MYITAIFWFELIQYANYNVVYFFKVQNRWMTLWFTLERASPIHLWTILLYTLQLSSKKKMMTLLLLLKLIFRRKKSLTIRLAPTHIRPTIHHRNRRHSVHHVIIPNSWLICIIVAALCWLKLKKIAINMKCRLVRKTITYSAKIFLLYLTSYIFFPINLFQFKALKMAVDHRMVHQVWNKSQTTTGWICCKMVLISMQVSHQIICCTAEISMISEWISMQSICNRDC